MNKTWLLGGALLLSLAGNAFLGGWLIARPAAAEAGLQGQPLRQLIAKVQELPPEQRGEVRAVIRQHAPQLRELAAANRENRQQLLDQLGQEPLDHAAVEQRFARQRQATAALQTAAQAMLLEIAERLPQEQRRRFLDRPEAFGAP
ncbi:periplasmic heavy metal sensor [Pseudomonas solani]|uniref:periplasmic heavy metal sensor n=1 Tax=Pseudomonas TaxID=286 RepID=UPI002927DEB6|nr:periplasmic heavy metal sensor [Pseudomonas sp. zfem005]MDU9416259.1 periplasmic heavy metal sensor [Pseudomonas sp. zfem005]